jgi:hypothetical protein
MIILENDEWFLQLQVELELLGAYGLQIEIINSISFVFSIAI